ncbi:MAG: 50S ribosomal protein L18 [Chitinophagales bacterium]|jgi:large subunit ribosomal protein L18|nr:50S ribosomal protein L18 [Sphingobacteriales bacterium]
MVSKQARRVKIHKKIRSKISGTSEMPRMTVYRSNKQIYVQLIDDINGSTLASASSKEVKDNGTKSDVSVLVGKAIAEKASSKGIANVVFDRGGFLYHGRVKALAEAAREAGLKF